MVCIRLTQHDFGRRLRRQPEDDKSEEREKDARQDEDVAIEHGDSLHLDLERQVDVRLVQPRVVDDATQGRELDQLPLLALEVVAEVAMLRRHARRCPTSSRRTSTSQTS